MSIKLTIHQENRFSEDNLHCVLRRDTDFMDSRRKYINTEVRRCLSSSTALEPIIDFTSRTAAILIVCISIVTF